MSYYVKAGELPVQSAVSASELARLHSRRAMYRDQS